MLGAFVLRVSLKSMLALFGLSLAVEHSFSLIILVILGYKSAKCSDGVGLAVAVGKGEQLREADLPLIVALDLVVAAVVIVSDKSSGLHINDPLASGPLKKLFFSCT